jgi:hypothetical protein
MRHRPCPPGHQNAMPHRSGGEATVSQEGIHLGASVDAYAAQVNGERVLHDPACPRVQALPGID